MPAPRPALLIVTTSYPLASGSVSGIFVKRLADALASHLPVNVICPASGGQLSPSDPRIQVTQCRYAPHALEKLAHTPGGIPVALANNPWNWLLIPGLLLSLFLHGFLNAQGKRGIVANWSICGLIGGIIGKLRNIPVIVTLRGDDVTRARRATLSSWALRVCITLCDHIIVVSDAMHENLCKRYPRDRHKIDVIHNGVDTKLLELPLPTPEVSIRLLYLGSLIPRKSVHTAISALAELPANFSLHIVGEGPEEAKLRELVANLEISTRVKFSKYYAPDSIPRLFAESDILILPSLAEGRPNVVIEAMAAGRPVVASDIDGIHELLKDCPGSPLFPPGNAHAMATSLNALSNPQTRIEAGQHNRRYIAMHGLTWQDTAQRYLDILNHVSHDLQQD